MVPIKLTNQQRDLARFGVQLMLLASIAAITHGYSDLATGIASAFRLPLPQVSSLWYRLFTLDWRSLCALATAEIVCRIILFRGRVIRSRFAYEPEARKRRFAVLKALFLLNTCVAIVAAAAMVLIHAVGLGSAPYGWPTLGIVVFFTVSGYWVAVLGLLKPIAELANRRGGPLPPTPSAPSRIAVLLGFGATSVFKAYLIVAFGLIAAIAYEAVVINTLAAFRSSLKITEETPDS